MSVFLEVHNFHTYNYCFNNMTTQIEDIPNTDWSFITDNHFVGFAHRNNNTDFTVRVVLPSDHGKGHIPTEPLDKKFSSLSEVQNYFSPDSPVIISG